MYRLETIDKDGIIYETSSYLLERSIFLAFTTRHKGVSAAPYDSLNLAFHVGDDSKKVIENRQIISKTFDFDIEKLTTAQQVHGNNVALINTDNAGAGRLDYESAIKETDALATGLQNVPLAMFFADCLPVVLVSEKPKLIAIAHAGYKGLLNNVISNLQSAVFGQIKSSNLLAFLGPSIGPCCYTVDKKRSDAFRLKFPKISFQDERIDLKAVAAFQLEKLGFKEENIYKSSYCTCCNSDLFYSFRRNGSTGRQSAIVMLTKN